MVGTGVAAWVGRRGERMPSVRPSVVIKGGAGGVAWVLDPPARVTVVNNKSWTV